MRENTYFTAVALPDAVKRRLAEWCGAKQKEYPFRRWVHPEDYHITLKYLGACSPQTLDAVKQQLASTVPFEEPFKLSIGELGFFGRSDFPRILWAGVQGDVTSLHHLQKTVERGMEKAGFPEENRPYRPHITLAKHFQGEQLNMDAMVFSLDVSLWQVSSVVLYRTELGRQPMYVKEAVYSLSDSS